MKRFVEFKYRNSDLFEFPWLDEFRATIEREESGELAIRIQQRHMSSSAWRNRELLVWDTQKGEWRFWDGEGTEFQQALAEIVQREMGLGAQQVQAKEAQEVVVQDTGETTVVPFGKHNGKTIKQIAGLDWGYLEYMSRERIVRGGVNYSAIAGRYTRTHAEPEIDVCPVCGETSCDGWHWKR